MAAPQDVFVIGATGFVGGGLATHLAASGHRVRGLARSADAAERLRLRGIEPHRGDLGAGRREVLAAAATADAVVYAAQLDPSEETAVVDDLVAALRGTGTTLLFVSGSGVFLQRTAGAWSPDVVAEDDPFTVEPLATARYAAEQTVRRAAADGLRAMVLRPGLIWGPGDHGHVSEVYRSVAAVGAACYVGEGLNVYSHVHIDDLARLGALVLAEGTVGAVYHAAAGEIPNRWIAEAVAADLGCPTRSLTVAEATDVWGEFGALIMSATSRCRDPRSRGELGWRPEHTDMLTMVGEARLRALAGAPHPEER